MNRQDTDSLHLLSITVTIMIIQEGLPPGARSRDTGGGGEEKQTEDVFISSAAGLKTQLRAI